MTEPLSYDNLPTKNTPARDVFANQVSQMPEGSLASADISVRFNGYNWYLGRVQATSAEDMFKTLASTLREIANSLANTNKEEK